MFEVGQFVKVKEEYNYLGNKYKFKITEVKEAINPACLNVYKIMRDKQCSLEPIYGPYDYQLKKIYEIEDRFWREDELEPYYKVSYAKKFDDAVDSLVYTTTTSGLSVQKTYDSIYNAYNANTTLIDEFNKIQKSLEELSNKNVKEENEMEILRLYNERKSFEINNNYNKELQKIQKEDTIQKIILEMQLQINTILENENRDERVDLESPNKELLTTESKEKISKLEAETDRKKDKLHASLEEIRALFEMTEDYKERMKILEKYGIIKNGKVNI